MKNYFRLFGYCHLVLGEDNSCIYNINTGNMISLTKEKTELLTICEKNKMLTTIEDCDYDFLNKLQEMQLGDYYDTPVFIEKFRSGMTKEMISLIMPNTQIKNAQIELTNDCNMDCKFCEKGNNILYRKTGCKRWLNSNQKMTLDMWKKVIDDLSAVCCEEITIVGGEPFLEFDLLKSVVESAIEKGIKNFTIYTNGTILNDEIIEFVQANNIKLILQVLSLNESTYKEISNVDNAYVEVQKNMKKLKEASIDFTILFLVNRFNEDEINLIHSELVFFTNKIIIDYIYSKPENNYYSTKIEDLMNNYRYKLVNANLEIFDYLQQSNCCYGNKIAITSDGNVLPCIMSRPLVLSNLFEEDNILCALNEKYYEFKELNKDKIDGCKKCSYRYGCLECRAIEMSATGKIDGMHFCNIKKD